MRGNGDEQEPDRRRLRHLLRFERATQLPRAALAARGVTGLACPYV